MLYGIKIKVKQVHGAECNFVVLVVISVFRSFLIFFNIKKVHHEKSATYRHVTRKGESEGGHPCHFSKIWKHCSNLEKNALTLAILGLMSHLMWFKSFWKKKAQIFSLPMYCGWNVYQGTLIPREPPALKNFWLRAWHEKRAIWQKYNMKRVQHEKRATWKKCHIVLHEKSATWKKCNMEKVQHEKIQHEESSTWKKCNMKKVQHGKRATWKKCNMKEFSMKKVLHGKSAT